MNIFDWLIIAAVALSLFFAVRGIRKKGSGACSGCSGACSSCGACGRKERECGNGRNKK